MGLPSLRTVFTAAADVLRRFPLVLLSAAAATTAGLVLAGDAGEESPWMRVLLASLLGLPLFTALTLLAERRVLPPALRVALPLAAAASLVAFGFAATDWLEPQLAARTIQFLLALHLIASFLPYAGESAAPGFWPYNKTLFLRFLVAALFSAVLFGGLALAMAAVDKLFGVSIDEDYYLRLFLLVALVFHPWYFLGGIPRDLSTLDSSTDYPGGLRVFAQYILVPLVTIYLAILTAYFVRVIVTREWPSGWIGWLVSSVSVAGLLAQLLVHPVKDRHAWVATCTRAFHVGLLPATVMLFAAIGKRVEQYGITENRYFLAAWAVWILGIALYFTFGRRKSIRVIPSSMAAVALVTSFGPWGAYAVAERSQIGRMEALLTEHGLLVDGRAVVAKAAPPPEVRRELSAIVRYLMRHHGADGLRPWFEDGLAGVDSVAAAAGSSFGRGDEGGRAVLERFGVAYEPRWKHGGRFDFHYAGSPHGLPVDVRDFDTAVRFDRLGSEEAEDEETAAGYSLEWDGPAVAFVIRKDDATLMTFPADGVLSRARELSGPAPRPGGPPREPLRMRARTERMRGMLALESLSGRAGSGGEGWTVLHASGMLYLGETGPGRP